MTGVPTTVSVIGCGHVGYSVSLLASVAGFDVVAIDIDPDVVASVNRGDSLMTESGFAELAQKAKDCGRLSARLEPVSSSIYVIAVPTPLSDDGKSADLSMVTTAVESLVPVLAPGALVIVESTVPPGSARNVILPLLESGGLRVGQDLLLAHCPERVLPGRTLDELSQCGRIIGGFDAASTDAAREFYQTFSKGELIETDLGTAEFVKPMENTYRDVNIALANTMAELAELHGVDINEAVRLANGHPRVDYLHPGIGVGGHCIPVDPWFLTSIAGSKPGVVDAARMVNDRQPSRYATKILDALSHADSPRILIIGAAYKPNVGDIRNSPALAIRDQLESGGVRVSVYDPHTEAFGGDLVELADGADAIVILVPHTDVLEELADKWPLVTQVVRAPLVLEVGGGGVVPAAIGSL